MTAMRNSGGKTRDLVAFSKTKPKSDSHRLQSHSQSTLQSAVALLQHHARPNQASYLSHVALECHIKARIVANYSGSISNFKNCNPELFNEIFRGREGHSLDRLLVQLNFSRILAADGADNPCIGPAWTRIVNSKRPYSLRYGEETLSMKQAKEEMAMGSAIIFAIGTLP